MVLPLLSRLRHPRRETEWFSGSAVMVGYQSKDEVGDRTPQRCNATLAASIGFLVSRTKLYFIARSRVISQPITNVSFGRYRVLRKASARHVN